MKNTIITLVFIFLFTAFAYSQEEYSNDYGKITKHELTMTEYEKDKDAEAVVIYDFGNNYFVGEDAGFVLYMERRTKIKILKQAGTKYAEFEIPLYVGGDVGMERIDRVEAITYNYVNGRIVQSSLESSKTKIFTEKVNDRYEVKKFALPDVREGSVIEVRYRVSTPYYLNMAAWRFQQKIPVIYSKLTYKAIPYYEYSYILKGASKFDEFNSKIHHNEIQYGHAKYKEMIYNFGMKDVPAFKDEEFITSPQNYIKAVYFQLSKMYYLRGGFKTIISTWPEMCDDFLKEDYFGKYINNSEKEAKKILPTLGLDGKSQLEQLEIISKHVKSTYSWNKYNTKFSSQKVSDFMKKKTGNAADINLFLIGLLKGAKIQVNPVILSTRDHGSISKGHPFQQFFNYVIAQVIIDGKTYLIDATEPLLYYQELPERCLNVEGLVVKPKTEEWTTTLQENIAMTEKSFDITVFPEWNKMDVKAVYTGINHDAYKYRSIYLNKEDNLSSYLLKRTGIDMKETLKVDSNDDLSKPFSFSFEFPHVIDNTGEKIFFNPFSNLAISDNPFKQTSRTLTVDLIYLKGEKYKSLITIPEGYKVEHLPAPLNHNGRQMAISYSAQEVDGKIEVYGEYAFKSNIYEAKDYIALKISMDEVIKRFSEMIVLVKK